MSNNPISTRRAMPYDAARELIEGGHIEDALRNGGVDVVVDMLITGDTETKRRILMTLTFVLMKYSTSDRARAKLLDSLTKLTLATPDDARGETTRDIIEWLKDKHGGTHDETQK